MNSGATLNLDTHHSRSLATSVRQVVLRYPGILIIWQVTCSVLFSLQENHFVWSITILLDRTMAMDIEVLLDELKAHDALCRLSFSQVMSFITRAAALKRDIMQAQPLSVPIDCAPDHLPLSVSQFLSDSVGRPFDCMHNCWKMLKDVVWDHPSAEETKRADTDTFKVHGQKRGLSTYTSCVCVLRES